MDPSGLYQLLFELTNSVLSSNKFLVLQWFAQLEQLIAEILHLGDFCADSDVVASMLIPCC